MPDDGKRTVPLKPDAGLLERTGHSGPNLAATVEGALSRHVRSRPHLTDEELAHYVECANERYDRYGSAAEDYLPV